MADQRHPKTRTKRRLDRQELAEASNERIDAVTAEELHPTKFVELLSPDGKLRLFYNTSTLIRIGLEKGKLMQPPHFREEMTPELRRKIELLEGRTITVAPVARPSGDDNFEVVHNHVHFEQIVDEFFLINPAQVFVCPQCYERWLELNPNWRRPVDPLTAILAMEPEARVRVVFRWANDFKYHLSNHHWMKADPNDHRLRDVLCRYFSDYNEKRRGRARELTLQYYWRESARFNVVRYNDLVDEVERATLEQRRGCAFPDPPAPAGRKQKKSGRARINAPVVDDDEDWIVDDDECDEGAEWTPHVEASSSSESSTPCGRRKRSRPLHSSPSTSSSSGTSESSSDDDDEDEEEEESAREVQAPPSKSGYLSAHSAVDRLTFVEREFVQREMERVRRQSSRNHGLPQFRHPARAPERGSVPEDDEDLADWINGAAPGSNEEHPNEGRELSAVADVKPPDANANPKLLLDEE